MRPAAKYAHGIKSKAASAKAFSISISPGRQLCAPELQDVSSPAMEHGVHLALPSTSCITTSRCSDVTIRAWKYSSSSSIIIYNALFCSQVPQLLSYFEIPFTERQSCSCAMTKLSGLKIMQNSASKQLQHYRIVHMALLDTLLHFSPPKWLSN